MAGWERFYGYGIRNQYGIAIDPITGFLWQSENGEPGLEEINLFHAGFNGGWETPGADVFGFVDPIPDDIYEAPRSYFAQPQFVYRITTAPTAVAFHRGASLWNDMLVAEGHFSSNHRIYHFELNEQRDGLVFDDPALQDLEGNSFAEMQPIIFAENFGIISDMETGPDGFLYVVDFGNNSIKRIRPRRPTGDGDGDGDHDLADHQLMQNCFTGDHPNPQAMDACRAMFDADNDRRVGSHDTAILIPRLTGPLDWYWR